MSRGDIRAKEEVIIFTRVVSHLAAVTPRTLLELCRAWPAVTPKLAKSTRLPGSLPVFYHFYPSTRFFKFLPVLGIPISKKKIKKKKKKKLFLPVNIGEIRELINHFRSYRP